MRTEVISTKKLKGRAIAGTYLVILAWDFSSSPTTQRKGLLGFAIERTEFDKEGNATERYWMKGIKRFKDKDKGLPPGTPVSTAEHPFQSFQWSDYTAKENTRYEYRVVPAYGTIKMIELEEDELLVPDITTEPEMSSPGNAASAGIRHDLFSIVVSSDHKPMHGNLEIKNQIGMTSIPVR